MRWPLFLCGVFFLLISAFMDNARGTLIPVLANLYHFDYTGSGQILVAGQLAALCMTALLLPATNFWSLKQIGIGACLIGVAVSTASLFVTSQFSILVWGAALGGSISVMGSLSSLFTEQSADLQYKTRAMAGCHAFYGLASFIAPVVAGRVLLDVNQWRMLYLALIPLLIGLSLFCWNAVPRPPVALAAPLAQPLDLRPQHWLAVAVVVFYVAGEVLAAMWMTAWFLSNGHTLQEGAIATSIFFILMTITRILCSFFVTPSRVTAVLWASILVPTAFFMGGRLFDNSWLVPMMGLLGPFFPLFVTRTSLRFPERSRTIIIWMLTSMQALLAVMNFVTGHVADRFGMGTAYWFPPVLTGICAVLFGISLRVTQLKEAPHQ